MPSLRKLSLVASAIAVSASAHANKGHAHMHRAYHAQAPVESSCGVVTATKTIWVQPTSSASSGASSCGVVTKTTTIYGPSPVSTTTQSTYKASSSSSSAYVTSSSAPVVKAAYIAPISSAVAAISSVVASIPKPSPKPSNNGGSATIAPNGNKWAMTYTPFDTNGNCKDAGTVASDLQTIASKGFTSVRIYGTDAGCGGLQKIGDGARAAGLKMIVGVWIDGSGIGSATDAQLSEISSWGSSGNWGLVEIVVVGNEAIFNNYASASGVANLISQVKSQFGAAGYTGLVTTTEPLGTIQANGDTLCPVVDVIAANIHPYFNAGVSSSSAGSFVASSLNDLSAVCNGAKPAYNLETGWPTQGNNNGLAIPGFSDQKTAIDGILSSAGSRSVFFSYTDDQWKSPGPFNVEQYWGCNGAF